VYLHKRVTGSQLARLDNLTSHDFCLRNITDAILSYWRYLLLRGHESTIYYCSD
jgi:hypothetical protein